MLKVIITGAYSTGKTTLVSRLAERLSEQGVSVVVLPDIARSSPFPLNRQQTDETSLWLVATQLAREIESRKKSPDLVICDRGIPDVMSHQEEVKIRQGFSRFALLEPFLVDWIKTYDLIFFSKIDHSKSIIEDGLRVLDIGYQKELEDLTAGILSGISNVFELAHHDDERLTYVYDTVIRRLAAP